MTDPLSNNLLDAQQLYYQLEENETLRLVMVSVIVVCVEVLVVSILCNPLLLKVREDLRCQVFPG